MNFHFDGIGYMGLEVDDLEVWRDFCVNVLGMSDVTGSPVVFGNEEEAYFKADDRAFRYRVKQGSNSGLTTLGFDVRDEEALEHLVSQLQAAGHEPREAEAEVCARRGVSRMVTLTDPEGIELEFVYGAIIDGAPKAHPQSMDFFTEHGFGHVVLMTPNPEPMLELYRKGLGFRVSDYIRFGENGGVDFLRSGPRHHSVAISCAGPSRGTHHIAVQLKDVDQVGKVLDRVMDRGYEITASLGRHKNDRMLSFYMRGPSGFDVEVGCDALLIDERTWHVRQDAAGDLWGHRGLSSESLQKREESA
ncbi:VOC family protein [Enemella sp. A6]|uniref:VOC family protein n=1 Tax=Enemella sp. A6 TaxID=3440152 RepID=UPI003EB6A138